MPPSSEQAAFEASVDVSRETIERLERFAALLNKWNPRINLVSASTLPHIWSRHILDSAQIFDISTKTEGHWVDIGSGGGLPALVLAAIAAEKAPRMRFTLVESDVRKATFLREAAREMSVPVTVLAARIEAAEPLFADVLTARALAPLPKLLELAQPHMKPDAQAIFPKGVTFNQELASALEKWTFHSDEYPSKTDANAVILSLGAIKRV